MRPFDEYDELLAEKLRTSTKSGFEPLELHNALFEFQLFIVRRALIAGKYAIFADCGLGKTFMQLVWAREVANHMQGKVLILAPLAVVWQAVKQGRKGIGFELKESYYNQAKSNLASILEDRKQTELF